MVIAFLHATLTCSSQQVVEITKNEISSAGLAFLYSVNGEPFSVTKFVKVVEGSPFFKEDWTKCSIILNSGKEYNEVPLRMNLLENKVHYQDNKGQEMIASSPVWQVMLTDSSTGITYSFVHSSYLGPGTNSQPNCWLLNLQTGHVGLYKQLYKSISESRPYGSATTEQRIKTVTRYFILKDNHFKPVRKWQDLSELLADRKSDIHEYISSNQLKGKSESDYISLVKFYNELSW